jgi:hypothetical protein
MGGGYPPPGGYGGPPPGGYGGQPQINNNLVWAILTTVFCCLPLGIVSIVFAAQVNGKLAAGDVAGAMDSAKKAKTWAMASAGVGVVLVLLYVAVFVFLGAASFVTS